MLGKVEPGPYRPALEFDWISWFAGLQIDTAVTLGPILDSSCQMIFDPGSKRTRDFSSCLAENPAGPEL